MTFQKGPFLRLHPMQSNRDRSARPESTTNPVFDPRMLVDLFDHLFLSSTNTRLVGGAEEPLYQPAEASNSHHRIYFTRDYFASALHEVAHWCIAGELRRKQTDYGYWYRPDGRTSQEQRQFEAVETKPQALEWLFCCAANYPFRLSVDNLGSQSGPSEAFKQGVWQQAQAYCQLGLPTRGQQFAQALVQAFQGNDFLNTSNYRLERLK